MTVNSVPHDGDSSSILASQSLLPWLEGIAPLDNILAEEFTSKQNIDFPAPAASSAESEQNMIDLADLTFYPNREAGATWKTLPAFPDDWIWEPGRFETFPQSPTVIGDMHDQGWEDTGSLLTGSMSLWMLFSQLTDVRLTAITGLRPDLRVWVPSADKQRCDAMPFLLAFSIPPDRQKRVEEQENGIKKLQVKRSLPPAQLGQVALFPRIHEGQPVWVRCTIADLGKRGQQLQTRLGAALNQLEVRPKLERSAWLKQWEGIQKMARQLAAEYWNVLQETQQEPSAPDFNVLRNGMAEAYMNAPLFQVMRGIQDAARGGRHWQDAQWTPEERAKDVTKSPFYTAGSKRGGISTMLSLRAPDSTIPEEVAASAWEKLRARPIDLDAYFAFLMHYYNTPAAALTADGFTTIYFTRMADYLDYAKKTTSSGAKQGSTRDAGHKDDVIRELSGAIDRLAYHWVDIAATAPGKKRQLALQGHLLMTKHRLVQRLMQADGTIKETPVAIQVKPDDWMRAFDTGGMFKRQIGIYLQQVLTYHNRKEQWEKGLAYYFTFLLRFTAGEGGNTLRRSVATLLDECSLWGDKEYAQRYPRVTLREPFERALNRLVKDKVIASWCYVEDPTQDLPRGWLGDWLKQMVEVSIGPLLLDAAPGVRSYQKIIDDVNAKAETQIASKSGQKQVGSRQQGKRTPRT